ncbi:hypothetical protein B0H10DRAFT_574556 [Mycena sp. CBHHK59/15]|nr:hypothetical protein B0H10DRAFT_574556 [Mycena sp. CBHHK59/15]
MTILRRPPVKVFVLAIVAIVALTAYAYNVLTTRSPLRSLQPVDHTTFPSHVQELNHPTFSDIRQYERTLPQQVLPAFWTKARPKYLSFPWEAWGTG